MGSEVLRSRSVASCAPPSPSCHTLPGIKSRSAVFNQAFDWAVIRAGSISFTWGSSSGGLTAWRVGRNGWVTARAGPFRVLTGWGRLPIVRHFETTMAQLRQLVNWLDGRGVLSVARESMYVSRNALHPPPDEQGLGFLLVNARQLEALDLQCNSS